MATKLYFGKDEQGYNAFAPIPSTNVFTATLVNGAASSITLPETYKAWIVTFSAQPGTNVFVDFTGSTAAVPAGGSFAASTSELNPGARTISTFDADGITPKTISLITNNASTAVSIALYGVEFAN